MDVQEEPEEGASVEEENQDGVDSPRHLYPELDVDGALEEIKESGDEKVVIPMGDNGECDVTGDEDLEALLPAVPSAPPADDDDDEDVPNNAGSSEMPAVLMQPFTERQILGLYTNEQMEHNAQFVDMFLAEQVDCRRDMGGNREVGKINQHSVWCCFFSGGCGQE